jgi:sigma-B regulation protein RsbU (phosphoserine phosphatase)
LRAAAISASISRTVFSSPCVTLVSVASDLIPRHAVYSALRLNLPYFAVACAIAIGGAGSLLLARLRSRDRLLLWAGICSILYAVRLFAQNELVRAAFNAPGNEYVPLAFSISYLINIPFAFFALELLGPGWKASIAIWAWLCCVFPALAIPVSLLIHRLQWVDRVNSVLVIGGILLLLSHLFAARRAGNSLAASLFWPLVVFGLFVFFENEGITLRGLSIEPIGILALLIGLGSVALRRALATERKLMDVEQELSTARRIQFAILPESPPDFEGVRLAMRYQPMTSVAGDFYDFLVSGDLLTILVADVSGHGVPAALVSSTLKVCFSAQKMNASDPAAILSGLGRMLRGSLGGQYVTAACATIDRKSRMITYSAAGHPPSILVRGKEGDAVFLDQNGLFLGPFPNAAYDNMSTPFRRGDRLFLYTDGITEAGDCTGEEFGRERLREFLVHSNGTEPDSALDRLFKQITEGNPQDDLTAVLVHFE